MLSAARGRDMCQCDNVCPLHRKYFSHPGDHDFISGLQLSPLRGDVVAAVEESAGQLFKRTKTQPLPQNEVHATPSSSSPCAIQGGSSTNPAYSNSSARDRASPDKPAPPNRISRKRGAASQPAQPLRSGCLSSRRVVAIPYGQEAPGKGLGGVLTYISSQKAAAQVTTSAAVEEVETNPVDTAAATVRQDWRVVDLGRGRLLQLQHHSLTNALNNREAALQRGFAGTLRDFEVQGAMLPEGPVRT